MTDARKKREAEPEAEADPAVLYSGYYGHPYAYGYGLGGYYGDCCGFTKLLHCIIKFCLRAGDVGGPELSFTLGYPQADGSWPKVGYLWRDSVDDWCLLVRRHVQGWTVTPKIFRRRKKVQK
mgnify:CR=1 FL=1